VEEAVNRHHYRLLHLVRHHDPHDRLHLRPQDRDPLATDRVRRGAAGLRRSGSAAAAAARWGVGGMGNPS
jgi:hypothetical protein